ncbi:MAG: translation elongation factor 4 [Candidatus Portnoybacteria bacterium]
MDQSNIKNFCIISHVDHGKSTLADRFLELTGTIEKRKMHEQFLDMMDLEREKGITIKLQPVRMEYNGYILNLIDTPGHVDFTYEVSRSLAAVEGAVLLVDASQGIQAQTLANLHLARQQDLIIIPVINKIDLSHAQVEETAEEMSQLLEVEEKDILRISAKQGTNIEEVLKRIIEKIPSPQGSSEKPLRALIFDSVYDDFKGVIAYVRIVDGQIEPGEKIEMIASKAETEIMELGVLKPNLVKSEILKTGEIGYIATGLKDISKCRVGDTITLPKAKTESLPGYKEPKPVVFASFYPSQANDYNLLKDGLDKLKLNDAALSYEPESSEGLGRGFRSGFLGMLHLEIISERLKRERNLDLVITSPSVSYQIRNKKNQMVLISSPSDLKEGGGTEEIKEPWVKLEIIAPNQYLGSAMKLLQGLRGEYKETKYLSASKILIEYEVPLNEIITDFYDKLKNTSSGYASMNYEMIDYRKGDLVKMDILVAGDKVDAFSRIVHREKSFSEGKAIVKKLKEVIPPQLFAVSLQAAIGGNIISRETIRAMRKDVTGYLYGGDYTRKRKLLEKQKRGKKKMKQIGKVNIPSEVFLKVLKK